MYDRKCGGFIEVNPIYDSDPTVSWHCLECGNHWEYELNNTGPGGLLARYLKNRSNIVSNGV